MNKGNPGDVAPLASVPDAPWHANKEKLALWATLGAYGIWGIMPLYWYGMLGIPALEILCHRIFWSFLLMVVYVFVTRRLTETLKVARQPRVLLGLFCTSLCLSCNWLLYVWAVLNGHILEGSLGYYINPLLSILAGVLVFGNRASRVQCMAIALAFLGVVCQVVMVGRLPWISLVLGTSFTIYAMLRRVIKVEAVPGMFWETLFTFPVVTIYIIWLFTTGASSLGGGGPLLGQILLVGTGVCTTVPLIWFAIGARHLSFITLGLIQYSTPSLAFLIGVFVFKAEFTNGYKVSFLCIWTALIIYSIDMLRSSRRSNR